MHMRSQDMGSTGNYILVKFNMLKNLMGVWSCDLSNSWNNIAKCPYHHHLSLCHHKWLWIMEQ